MAEKYSVVFSGRLREGETPDAVKVRLAEVFRVRPEQLEPLFLKTPAVMRRGLDEATAAKWVAAVEKTGALCWAEPDRVDTPPVAKPVSPPAQAPPAPSPAPPGAEPVVPSTPPPVAAVAPVAEPVRKTGRLFKNDDVVPFPKCPKCGRLPQSIEDSFMRTGVCPQCGLILRKYASNWDREGFWGRLGMVEETDRHWAAFWQSSLWPSYWRATWYLCCALLVLPALGHVLDVSRDEVVVPTIVGMGVAGIQLAVLGILVAVASFYCFALYQQSRRMFLIHVAGSAGICAVLAVAGGLLAFLVHGIGCLSSAVGVDRLLNPVRALGFAALAFFGIVLYFGLVRFPAEKQLWEYLDGPEYPATVRGARTLAGLEFPTGSRGDKYRYYRFVFVEPTRTVDPDFERVLTRLLPDFNPHSYGRQHGSEVNLLVFNAIAFRDELTADRLIASDMRSRLDQLAAEWERSRAQSATRLVRALDSRSPIGPTDLRPLAKRN
ncbi:MAG: hypothetical protein ACE15E_09315 [Acidobacteriota bacterium]